MRYEEFRDLWQAALGQSHWLGRPEETIDLNDMGRHWRVHLLPPQRAEPFHVAATISFRWGAFENARSAACEEDLQTELFGHRAARPTQARMVRVDIGLHATLPHGSTTALPAPDVLAPWVASIDERLDRALLRKRLRRDTFVAWHGELEIEARATQQGAVSLGGISVPAFDMVTVPRVWDDPRRRAREPPADREIAGLAERFRNVLDAWSEGVAELVRWMRHAPAPPGGSDADRNEGQGGPETTH